MTIPDQQIAASVLVIGTSGSGLRAAPGDPGTPPHRHPGPAFGYVLEGEMAFELEGEPARVLRAGEAFWDPGGDVIHYQDRNNRDDIPVRFTVTMLCVARPVACAARRPGGGAAIPAAKHGMDSTGRPALSFRTPHGAMPTEVDPSRSGWAWLPWKDC